MAKRVSVRLGRGAKADLRTIRDYLTEKAGSVTADTFTRTILDLVDKLEQFPERGPIPEEIGGLGIKGIRQISARAVKPRPTRITSTTSRRAKRGQTG